jgi:hypothetical protein
VQLKNGLNALTRVKKIQNIFAYKALFALIFPNADPTEGEFINIGGHEYYIKLSSVSASTK